MDNLKLWKSVEVTDPAHVSKINVSGQKRTSVKAIFQKEKATEIFGIQGVSWGVKIGTENYERLHIGEEIMLQYRAVLFFKYESDCGELPIAASVMEARLVKKGTPEQYLRIDDEAIKKVRTDAMTKGLSELGFNADIFKGYFDSSGYAEHASSVVGEEMQDRYEQEQIQAAEEYKAWKDQALNVYASLNTNKAIETTFTGHVRKATKMNDKAAIKQFQAAKEARQAELKKEQEK